MQPSNSTSSQQKLQEKMEYQKLLENKENEARQQILNIHSKVMDGSLKSKISTCSEDNSSLEEERIDPMLLKEREAANFLAQHADMVRNGTWKKMKLEQEKRMREERKMKEEEKMKQDGLKEENNQNLNSKDTVEPQDHAHPSVEPSRRKILRFLCCTVVEESY
ncbi:hypothetical protein GpartN1_g5899.t1 [Galdieria partita]|uniref:Uncharacterized protein n=1 Tax=Galdieria partita TaxID=83374 RepID=A0A9C7USR3_9RHOD|nr:hypothetical protein GpartN1_g5899.t1 [Galdieria partita]